MNFLSAPPGPVLPCEDGGFYLGSVLAELLVARGWAVHFVASDDAVASWMTNSLEVRHIRKRLHKLCVDIRPNLNLVGFDGTAARLACVDSDCEESLAYASAVIPTSRLPNDELHQDLLAHSVYAGHRNAREHEALAGENHASEDVPFRRHGRQRVA